MRQGAAAAPVEDGAADRDALIAEGREALQRGDAQTASELAIQALAMDQLCGDAWRLLAGAREKAGDLVNALAAYEAALARLPEQPALANEAGRIAVALGQTARAVQLFAHYHRARPDCLIGANNLAAALRQLHHFDAAIEVLRTAIQANPDNAMLWNTLGCVLSDRGEPASALTFFEEARRLAPQHAKMWQNISAARLALGDADGALDACEAALERAAGETERVDLAFSKSTILLCQGRLAEGWKAYENRLDPAFTGGTQFRVDAPRWDLETPIAGKSLLLFGEQGLGDQVAFLGLAADILRELGPDGRLTIAVEQRLVSLAARAFPEAEVVALSGGPTARGFVRTLPGVDTSRFDLWTPMASPFGRYRTAIENYPATSVTLAPDGGRLAHWRRELAALPGLKVGLAWKSLNMDGVRRKLFPTFEQWRPVLSAPGVTFVNLQYGDAAPELAWARQALGVEIWTPPGLDLKDDLEGVAALGAALDLSIGPSNASTCIAAACGAPVWMITPPMPWTCQGSPNIPWFPTTTVFVAEGYGQWDPLMASVGEALERRLRA